MCSIQGSRHDLRRMVLIGLFVLPLLASWEVSGASAQSDTGNQNAQQSTGGDQNAAADVGAAIGKLGWVPGPKKVEALQNASFQIPDKFMFLDRADTAEFMRLTENVANGEAEQLFGPDDLAWFAVLSFSDDGYVKDQEKLDTDAILQTLKDGTEANNDERRKNGWAELHVTGWRRAPYYDERTKRLEWALDLADSTGQISTNFETKILGRHGVTTAILVTDPDHFDADLIAFKKMLTGYEFNAGDRYSEFKNGDKVATYGLAALIVGGAAAAAGKAGLFKVFGKFILIGGAAVLVAFKGFFKRMFGGRRQS